MGTSWQLTGDYFENCNCDFICPCLFSAKPQMVSAATQGACEVALAFQSIAAPMAMCNSTA